MVCGLRIARHASLVVSGDFASSREAVAPEIAECQERIQLQALLVDCNRQSGSDPMSWIGVLPLHGFRRVIVQPDIAHDLPFQILLRCKDAARDEIALDLRKPEFHLVEPGGVGRREMQVDGRMVLQERLHLFGFVRREIIEYHMNLLSPPLMGH